LKGILFIKITFYYYFLY